MSIWTRLGGMLGWRTWGPNSNSIDNMWGELGTSAEDMLPVTQEQALRLSAVFACLQRRAETIGTMPINLRDRKTKQIVDDHDLYFLLKESPNIGMSPADFWSSATANVDLLGNHCSLLTRRSNGEVTAIEPFPEQQNVILKERKSGSYFYEYAGERYAQDRILHLRGFSMNGMWGLSRLHYGRDILGAQLAANSSARRAFLQGLKVGGFFKMAENLTPEQKTELKNQLNEFGRPENAGKWMALLKGMEPVAGAQFRVSPADAELLNSRYFGTEEICRLFDVPPQLIGHTNKASSWASSLENTNLYFKTYSIAPTCKRFEFSIVRQLMSREDRRLLEPRFNMDALERADLRSRTIAHASALQNGWRNRNEIRDIEDLPRIPGEAGDEYTVQVNMTELGNWPSDQPPSTGEQQ